MLKTEAMSKMHNYLAGLGGAIALNVLHESVKRKDSEMPRVDLLGEEALQKTFPISMPKLTIRKASTPQRLPVTC